VDAERLRIDIEQAKRLEIAPEGQEVEYELPQSLAGGPPMFSSQSRKFENRPGWSNRGRF